MHYFNFVHSIESDPLQKERSFTASKEQLACLAAPRRQRLRLWAFLHSTATGRLMYFLLILLETLFAGQVSQLSGIIAVELCSAGETHGFTITPLG